MIKALLTLGLIIFAAYAVSVKPVPPPSGLDYESVQTDESTDFGAAPSQDRAWFNEANF